MPVHHLTDRTIAALLCPHIAFDNDGRPSFNALQNYGSGAAPVVYYVFDVMVLAGRDVMRDQLETRRELLEQKVLLKLSEPVRYATSLDAALPVLVQSVKAQGFEGLVAKRRNSVYEPGLRTGAWMKMRVKRGQEFVIGGYTRNQNVRCAYLWVLPGRQVDLRCENTQRVYTGHPRAAVQKVQRARDQ